MDPVTTMRDARITRLNMQDSELNGPAPELEANKSLAKLGLNGIPHSISSSARASSTGGKVRPSALAVLRYRLEFGRLLDRQVRRFRASENFPYVDRGVPIQIGKIWSVGHEAASLDKVPEGEDRRQSMPLGQRGVLAQAGTRVLATRPEDPRPPWTYPRRPHRSPPAPRLKNLKLYPECPRRGIAARSNGYWTSQRPCG
jgi:hypothetical protein